MLFQIFCVTLPQSWGLNLMNGIGTILLFSLGELMRLDILVWVASVPLLILTSIFFCVQYRQSRRLKSDLAQLAKVKRHTIEYDLVLKAMKLSVWRIDLPTHTITYESDYREGLDLPVSKGGSDVGSFCENLLPGSRERVHQSMVDLFEGRSDEFREQYEMRLPYGDQTCWAESFAIVDKRDQNGKALGVVGTSMRIDRQKAIERALTEARNHAEESDRLKSAFLANISHEVRTPLNSIVGFSEVLPMVRSEEERDKLLKLIKQNNAHLLRLFDDMVNMSKLEAGNETIQKEYFDLNTLLADVADRYNVHAAAKDLKLEVKTLADGPTLYTDRNRLGEIMNQYVNNAIKFTEKGSVTIGYDVKDNTLRLWVRDTGIGIPAEHCDEHLFERFVKVNDFVPGTGLGLSICRSLAQSIDARVGMESKYGEGSQFWVELAIG